MWPSFEGLVENAEINPSKNRNSTKILLLSYGKIVTGLTVRGSNPDGAKFSAPVQTGPGAHPAFYTLGTGSFPGVKRPGRGVDHPPHPVPRLKK